MPTHLAFERKRETFGVAMTHAKTVDGELGPDLFRAACRLGLEGLVSKHLDRPYQGGRSKHWVKVKNRKHPAMERVIEAFR